MGPGSCPSPKSQDLTTPSSTRAVPSQPSKSSARSFLDSRGASFQASCRQPSAARRYFAVHDRFLQFLGRFTPTSRGGPGFGELSASTAIAVSNTCGAADMVPIRGRLAVTKDAEASAAKVFRHHIARQLQRTLLMHRGRALRDADPFVGLDDQKLSGCMPDANAMSAPTTSRQSCRGRWRAGSAMMELPRSTGCCSAI